MRQPIYLDSSILISVVLQEKSSDSIIDMLEAHASPCIASDFAVLEFHDAIGRRSRDERRLAPLKEQLLSSLDTWTNTNANRMPMLGDDISEAIMLLRIAHPLLRAPDAIHLAAARRLGCRVFTLDEGMREAALRLNLPILA